MKAKEKEELVALIASRTADLVCDRLRISKEKPEWVDSNTAARILGLSPRYFRQLKNQFPHIKKGDKLQSRVLYKREAIEEHLKTYYQ